MNTKGIKFLAVLAVLAMAFAAFAVVSDDSDATGGAAIGDYTSTQVVKVPYGETTIDLTIKAQETATISKDLIFTGYSTNTKAADQGYNEGIYDGYAAVYIAVPAITGSVFTGITHVTFAQTSSLVKDIPVGLAHQVKSTDGNTLTSNFLKANISGQNFAILVPQDMTNVDVVVTFYANGGNAAIPASTADEVAKVSFKLDFSKFTTAVKLGTAMSDLASTSKWDYTVSGETGTLALNGFSGNVAFWEQTNNLVVTLKGSNALKATTGNAADENASIIAGKNNKTVTIESLLADTQGSLTVTQGNNYAYGISSFHGLLTIGNESKAITNVTVSGAAQSIMGNSNSVTIKNANVISTGAERAINTGSTGTLTITNSTIDAKVGGEGNNSEGLNEVFGIKAYNIDINGATTEIKTQGLYVRSGGTYSNEGIVYVLGDYEQLNIKDAFGIAGLFVAGTTEIAAQASSSASGGVATYTYVVGDAKAYGTNVTVAGGVKTAAGSSGEAVASDTISTAINTAAASQKELVYTLNKNEAKVLDLKDLYAKANVKALDSLTIINKNETLTITSTEVVDVAGKELNVAGDGITLSAAVKNGSDNINITGLTGNFKITEGSVKIIGDLGGTAIIEVDGTYDLEGSIVAGANVTIKAAEGKSALLKTIGDITIGNGATLNLQDIDVELGGSIILSNNTANLNLKADAALKTDMKVTGGNLSIADAQSKSIELDGVVVSSAIITSKDLTVSGGSIKSVTVDGALIIDGDDVTVKGGSSSAKTIVNANGDVTINANLSFESYVDFNLKSASEIKAATTVTIGANSAINNSSTLTVSGTTTGGGKVVNNSVIVIKGEVLNLDNAKTARLYGNVGNLVLPDTKTGALKNDGTVFIMDVGAHIYATVTGDGSIDTSGVASVVKIAGDITSTGTVYSQFQTVIFIEDSVIKSGADVTFSGEVQIEEGVTVTIEKGSEFTVSGALGKLINNGIISVQSDGKVTAGLSTNVSAAVENNGIILLDYDNATDGTKTMIIGANSAFTNNGTITVGEKSKLTINTETFINAEDAVINVNGVVAGTIVNASSVIVNTEKASEFTVDNSKAGATVGVISVNGALTIQDTMMAVKDKIVAGGQSLVINAAAHYLAGGLIVTEATYKAKATDTTSIPMMYLSGAFAISPESSTYTDQQEFSLTGVYEVKESLAVSDYATVDIETTGTTLTVSGEMTMAEKAVAKQTAAGKVIVTGKITSVKNDILGATAASQWANIYSAKYTVPKTTTEEAVHVYTNVNTAITEAVAAEIKTVDIKGYTESSKYVQFASDITIPAGYAVKINSGYVSIADGKVVEFAVDDGVYSTLNLSGNIDVGGKLVLDNKAKILKGTEENIASEVIFKVGDMVTYTSMSAAMEDVGTEEATIVLSGATNIKADTTIPENITIDTNGNNFTVAKEKTLTIDGVLYLNGGVYAIGDDAKVVVNGLIKTETKPTYDGNKFPAGVYFSADDAAYYYIGNIADVGLLALVADDKKLTYYGDLDTTAVEFDVKGTLIFNDEAKIRSLTVGSEATVTFKDDMKVDVLTMGVAKVTVDAGIAINTVIDAGVGTLTLIDAESVAAGNFQVTAKDGANTFEVAVPLEVTTEDGEIITGGAVKLTKNVEFIEVASGTLTIGADVTTYAIEANGDVYVDNGKKFTAAEALINGDFTAAAATSDKAKATATFGILAIGMELKDALGAVASVSGDVTANYVVVAPGSEYPESFEEMTYSSVVYTGDQIVAVVFGTTAADLVTILAPFDLGIGDENAVFKKYTDETGKTVANPKIGSPKTLIAVYDFAVYEVRIITDDGVKSVALNGIEMLGTGINAFYAEKLMTGTYTVTYTLKNGYEGKATLSTSTGTVLKDNKFTIVENGDLELKFQLTGTSPVTPTPTPTPPEPTPIIIEEDDSFGLTQILLIALVIMIGVLVVVLILRFNRS